MMGTTGKSHGAVSSLGTSLARWLFNWTCGDVLLWVWIMVRISNRVSLHVQLLDALRSGIEEAVWQERMPPESELCREFGVSRMTLRRALATLSEERWIALGGRGQLHTILPVKTSPKKARGSIVRVLTPYGWGDMSSIGCQILESVSAVLELSGMRLVVEDHPRFFRKFESAAFEKLVKLPDTAGWILFYANEAIQSKFASSNIPTIVAGRVSPGVALPGVYADVAASSVAASRVFAAKGHREAVYLISEMTSISDRAAAAAFVQSGTDLGMHARIVSFKPDCPSASRVITETLLGKPRPTAFMVGDCRVAITLLCQMLAAGIRVPDQASIICNWDDRALGYTQPVIARFRPDCVKMGKKLGQAIIAMIAHGKITTARETRLVPDFIMGGTLGGCAS